jgi:hypothetical protein
MTFLKFLSVLLLGIVIGAGGVILLDGAKWRKAKKIWFGKIQNRNDAIKLARDCGTVFFGAAGLQALGAYSLGISPALDDVVNAATLQAAAAYWLGISPVFDAVVYALCGYFIWSKQSRVAAVFALLLGLVVMVMTVVNRFENVGQGGGRNFLLALIVLWAGARAVEATFKLRGRFTQAESAGD